MYCSNREETEPKPTLPINESVNFTETVRMQIKYHEMIK